MPHCRIAEFGEELDNSQVGSLEVRAPSDVPTSVPGYGASLRGGLDIVHVSYNHMVMRTTATAPLTEIQLDRAFGALADPTRRAILARLSEGDAGVLDVARPFPMSQPAITKHLPRARGRRASSPGTGGPAIACATSSRSGSSNSRTGLARTASSGRQSFERLDELLEELQVPGSLSPGAPAPASSRQQEPRHRQGSNRQPGKTGEGEGT